jgi:hypothetical protein
MIKCICVNDEGKPIEIPREKWVTAGNEYHIVYVTFLHPNGDMAFQLKEIFLDETCLPYEYFAADRFIFRQEDFPKMVSLVEESIDISNAIADVNGALFEVIGTDGKAEKGQWEYEKALSILDLLNDIGSNAPYHLKQIYF